MPVRKSCVNCWDLINNEFELIEEQQDIDIQEIKELDYRVEEIPEDEDYRKMFIESCLQLNKEKINQILQWAKQVDRKTREEK